MTRQDYINLKLNNPTELIYIYYIENYKSGRKLSRNELMMYVQMYTNINSILNYVITEYDRKFDIVLLTDSNGNYIKSL